MGIFWLVSKVVWCEYTMHMAFYCHCPFRTDSHDILIIDILTSIFLSKLTSSVICSAGHEAIKNTIASTLGLNFLVSLCVVQCYVSKYPCSYSNEGSQSAVMVRKLQIILLIGLQASIVVGLSQPEIRHLNFFLPWRENCAIT